MPVMVVVCLVVPVISVPVACHVLVSEAHVVVIVDHSSANEGLVVPVIVVDGFDVPVMLIGYFDTLLPFS